MRIWQIGISAHSVRRFLMLRPLSGIFVRIGVLLQFDEIIVGPLHRDITRGLQDCPGELPQVHLRIQGFSLFLKTAFRRF